MALCSERTKRITVFSCSGILITFGIILVILWGTLYDRILKSQLVLAPGSTNYNMWKETPIPIYLDVYFFNWTNADPVLKDWTVKPHFEECGPYVFSEKHVRVNLHWNDNGTVTYQQKKIWQFEPQLSKGTLNDTVTNLNVIVATVANIVKDKHYLIRRAVDVILRAEEGHRLVTTKQVGQLLFDGYEDPLLRIVKKLNISGFTVPYDKFGWFYARNESETFDGIFNINTGAKDIFAMGNVRAWNGANRTDFYANDCGIVNGSTGELWPPVHDAERLTVFASDICSSLPLTFSGYENVHGVDGRKYTATLEALDNGYNYPDQSCFNLGNKVPSGARNVSACRFGAPAFLSYPHFYLADPSYIDAVDGLHPNKTLHQMYMSIEPNTGIPLDVSARMQINMRVQPVPGLSMFEKVATAFIPMIWFEQRATLTEDLASQTKMLLTLSTVGEYTGYGMIALGVLLGGIGMYITLRRGWKGTEAVSLIPQDKF